MEKSALCNIEIYSTSISMFIITVFIFALYTGVLVLWSFVGGSVLPGHPLSTLTKPATAYLLCSIKRDWYCFYSYHEATPA